METVSKTRSTLNVSEDALTKAARLGFFLLVLCCFQPSAGQWSLIFPSEFNSRFAVCKEILSIFRCVFLAWLNVGLLYLGVLHVTQVLVLSTRSHSGGGLHTTIWACESIFAAVCGTDAGCDCSAARAAIGSLRYGSGSALSNTPKRPMKATQQNYMRIYCAKSAKTSRKGNKMAHYMCTRLCRLTLALRVV